MIEIKSLSDTSFEEIFAAFHLAFSDYEIQINDQQLSAMLKRRGFNPDLSFAAFVEGRIVAFTLNGIGTYNGKLTAYDTGTGTLKQYRGQGLASKIFEYSIPFLKKENIEQYVLEVLQHNSKAVSVYQKLGFEVVREFNYFTAEPDKINLNSNKSDEFLISKIDVNIVESLTEFCDFNPSWQNSVESVKRDMTRFEILAVSVANKIVGYCIFEPKSGDITQLAVDKNYRRKGVGSVLLAEVSKLNQSNILKVKSS